MGWLRLLWPWCGPPFRQHRFVFVRKLTILGEARCLECPLHFLYNRQEQSAVPWSDRAAAFFARREARS